MKMSLKAGKISDRNLRKMKSAPKPIQTRKSEVIATHRNEEQQRRIVIEKLQ